MRKLNDLVNEIDLKNLKLCREVLATIKYCGQAYIEDCKKHQDRNQESKWSSEKGTEAPFPIHILEWVNSLYPQYRFCKYIPTKIFFFKFLWAPSIKKIFRIFNTSFARGDLSDIDCELRLTFSYEKRYKSYSLHGLWKYLHDSYFKPKFSTVPSYYNDSNREGPIRPNPVPGMNVQINPNYSDAAFKVTYFTFHF